MDDLSPLPGIRHAAILRSPHAHARVVAIDVTRAAALPGVHGVYTGADLAAVVDPMPAVVRSPIRYLPFAVDRARHVGEPLAVVVADDRYVAEDALELIEVELEPLPAVVRADAAASPGSPVLHDELGTNVVSERSFRYGDPDAGFANAAHVVRYEHRFPRYASTPVETFGVIAHHEPARRRFTVWSNFQGPFVLQPLMARALKVPGSHLRLITAPASGGSFGIKQAVASYVVLMGGVARLAGVPVRWTEDRAEHLTAASAASDRAATVHGAFGESGELVALKFENTANMGAYIRAPEPASLYRMHSASNGCYRVRNIAIDNRLVVTNTTPVGLNRGYGGPQFYFALERMMDIAARELGMDPAGLRRRNFIPADAFPYDAPAGSVYDSGDYGAALDELLRLADYEALREWRDAGRREGLLRGIGFGTGVEPSGSNMAYVSLAQPAEERRRAPRKSGANASTTISMDPGGGVQVSLCSTPNGQGHATAAARIVAGALGLELGDIDVRTELDTGTDAWSIASGNYSNRFSAIVAGNVAECAARVAGRLKAIAADRMEVAVEDVVLAGGRAHVAGVEEKSVPVRQLAAAAHWDPAGLPEGMEHGLRETTIHSPAVLDAPGDDDRIASAVTYGMVADLAAVEIERDTGRLAIHRYASVHDVGRQLNPAAVEGQAYGGLAHGLGAALMEELSYGEDGQFHSATFADYLVPTAAEVPEIALGHVDTPSPANATGSKGMGDGSSMLTPAVIANAVADALGRDDVELPLTRRRLWTLANPQLAEEEARAAGDAAPAADELSTSGEVHLSMPPEQVWRQLTDPGRLARVVPGCRSLRQESEERYRAEIDIGVARIRGVYRAVIEMRDRHEPQSMTLVATAVGDMGFGRGEGSVTLAADGSGGTILTYRWRARVGGRIASVGQRLLDAVMRNMIERFFAALDGDAGAGAGRLSRMLSRLLGGGSE